MKNIKKYISVLMFGLIISFIVFKYRNLFIQTNKTELYKILSDGFFLPAVLLTGFGLLGVIGNAGGIDGLSYAIKSFANFVKTTAKKNNAETNRFPKTYFDYKMQKCASKKSFIHFVVVGSLFLVFSLIFNYMFYIS